NRDAVGDLVNLVDEMGDEYDCDAMGLEIADDLEQQLGLVGIETGGGLIQHKDPRIVLECSRDRHQLLDRHRIGGKRALDIDINVEALQAFTGALSRRSPANEAEAAGLTAK